MKRTVTLLTLLLSIISQTMATELNAIVLTLASGSQVTYVLDERPVVTFQGDDLTITTHLNVVSYASSDVLKFTYSKVDTDGIGSVSANANFSIIGNVLVVRNLVPNSEIMVYSVDGLLLVNDRADHNGSVSVTLPNIPSNVYLIKTKTANFKITKP